MLPAPGAAPAGEAWVLPDAAARVALPTTPELRAIAQRNLFAPMRGTARDDFAPGPAGAAGLQLVGVAISGPQLNALLRLSDGRVKTVGLGGSISGWTLIDLTRDRATLRQGEVTITVQLARPPHPEIPAPPRNLD
jgi:hypothetical protein